MSSRRPLQLGHQQLDLLDSLAGGPRTVAALALDVGMPRHRVRVRLEVLQTRGLVLQLGERWQLSGVGAAALRRALRFGREPGVLGHRRNYGGSP